MSENLKLSIIIVNWNGKHLLKNCLSSIINETEGINYEIILVDNASTDGSVAFVEENFPRVKLIKNTENYGFAKGNNQGIKEARGEYLLLLNSDTITLDKALVKSLKRIEEDKTIGVLGCKLRNKDGSIQPSAYNFNSILNAFLYKSKLIQLLKKNEHKYKYEGLITSFDYNREITVDYVCGAFMLLRKDIIDEVGPLDESFFMYAEEADFCMRIRKAGYSILFYPGAEIIHLGGGSSQKISLVSQNRRIVSRLKLLKKHKGNIYYFTYKTLSLANGSLSYIIGGVTGSKDKKELAQIKIKSIIRMKYI